MPTERFPITLDLRKKAGTFPKYWIRCIGSECGGFMLRHDLFEHFRMAKPVLPMEYVRFHGILTDNVGVAHRNRKGKIEYTWYNLEKVYDQILDLGMRPFVEFSYMPEALARSNQHLFYYNANVTLPKKWSEWENLIEAVTRRIVKRYGRTEARHWYYEVWNEPNLPKWFFAGTQKDYFRLYDHAVAAVKKVDPHLRVGGPATACAEWVGEFIEHCRTENFAHPGRKGSPADFVSYHLYPTDPFFMKKESMQVEWMGEEFFRESIWHNRHIVDKYREMGLEIHMTEWSCSSGTREPMHDTPAGAAFAVKAIQEVAGAVDTFSWWTLSDIFCEGGLPPAPFHGGFGLLNTDGLKKPTWYAFQALQELGTDLLAQPASTPDHSFGLIPTKCADGTARLLAWAFHFPKSPKPPLRTVELDLRGLLPHAKRVSVEHYRIDEGHTNIQSEWVKLGKPDSLTREQASGLRGKNGFDLLEQRDIPVRNGMAKYSFKMPLNGVSYLVIR
jgi:xylan 1,4-beta-xylosidase